MHMLYKQLYIYREREKEMPLATYDSRRRHRCQSHQHATCNVKREPTAEERADC